MFAIERDVTDLSKCDNDVDNPAPYRILQEEYTTITTAAAPARIYTRRQKIPSRDR